MIIHEDMKCISIEKNQNISFDEIMDVAYVDDVIVQWKKNDLEDHQLAKIKGQGALFLSLSKPYFQPGRLSMIKAREIIVKADRETAAKLFSLLDKFGVLDNIKANRRALEAGIKDVNNLDEDSFPMTRCIVEAKIRSNNYVRGGTTGSNPYGKAGLVSAVLLPSVDVETGNFSFKYLGTNSSFHHSAFFSSQQVHSFCAKEADCCQYFINRRESKWLASVIYRSYAIEKDDKGKGIWYVKAEKLWDNLVEAALWLELARKMSQESPWILDAVDKEQGQEAPSLEDIDKEAKKKELEKALELLKKNGLMSQTEYDEKLGLIRLM